MKNNNQSQDIQKAQERHSKAIGKVLRKRQVEAIRERIKAELKNQLDYD